MTPLYGNDMTEPLKMDMLQFFRDALVQETGRHVDNDDFDALFSELGADPLVGVAVIERVTNSTGIEFPASLLRDCKSLSDIASGLRKMSGSGSHETVEKAPRAARPPREAPLPRGNVRNAFRDACSHVQEFLRKAGSANFWSRVYPAQRQLVLAFVNDAFDRLGCSLADMPVGTIVTYPRGVLDKHRRVFDGAIFEILADGGLVNVDPELGAIRTSTVVDKTPPQQILATIILEHPQFANLHRLLNVTGSQFAECLTGRLDPIKLLFGRSKDLLQDFYTNAPMSLAASLHLVAVIKRLLADGEYRPGKSIDILEVGAGLGGTTRFVVEALIEAQVPFRYVYTDISASFFAASKNRYKSLPPGSSMEFLVLDVEKPPPETLLGGFDVVVSTNCIHATRNLGVSCSNVRKLLRGGGFFALIEFTSRMYWLDLVFGLLDGWWLFEDGRKHCTVDETVWEEKLQLSGFSDVLWADVEGDDKSSLQLLVACTD